jgi:(p)ppGpp synthase/HD superfamily hydrolase
MKEIQSDTLERAVAFAVKSHEGLFRDGDHPLPYSTHPIEVLGILRYLGGVTDEELLAAAALHDTVEQARVKPRKIEKRFNRRIAKLVGELTRQEPPEAITKELSKDELRKVRFDALLKEVDAMSDSAKAIKLADRISNLRAAHVVKKAKLKQYLAESRELLAHIDRRVNPTLWDEASRLALES